jgi:lysozyme
MANKIINAFLRKWLTRIGTAGVLGGGSYYAYDSLQSDHVNFTTYPEFGIDIPDKYGIHGIDVAHHEGTINWNLVKKMQVRGIKIGFAFVKATEGVDFIDKQYKRNFNELSRINMPRGAYHFLRPKGDGRAQAKFFIKHVRLRKGDFPPVLDIEVDDGATPQEMKNCVTQWLRTVQNHYGVKPIIYTNADFYNRNLADYCGSYPLWVAHYFAKNKPRVSRSWKLWQYSEQGKVNGIIDQVDFNAFNGDSLAFKQLLIK